MFKDVVLQKVLMAQFTSWLRPDFTFDLPTLPFGATLLRGIKFGSVLVCNFHVTGLLFAQFS